MNKPQIVQFIIEKAEEGGYVARALFFPIFTQGETLDEIAKNIREAMDCHFEDKKTQPPVLINFELPVLA